MTALTYRNGIAIAELIFYFPALAVAILLTVRHGIHRSSGWIFLIIFCLARLVGACLELATIGDPTNVNLYIGSSIVQNIGLSPLELITMGLLTRLIQNINKTHSTPVQPMHLRLVGTAILVGLILGIVGGSQVAGSYAKTGIYRPNSLSQASIGVSLACFVILAAVSFILSFSVSHADQGEKRLLLAVALALPFILVRLIYSAVSVFTNTASFNSLSGNETIFLIMSVIMEIIAVAIFEAIGVTLSKTAPTYDPVAVGHNSMPTSDPSLAHKRRPRTLIGRLIASSRERRNMNRNGVEMQYS